MCPMSVGVDKRPFWDSSISHTSPWLILSRRFIDKITIKVVLLILVYNMLDIILAYFDQIQVLISRKLFS